MIGRSSDGGLMDEQAERYRVKRERMVAEQIRARGITDERVLAALATVPRHLFVPPGLTGEAYHDSPLPIGRGQTISQPYIVALMTSLLAIDERSRVLEIGTGSGYQTAVLAEIAAEVYSVERIAELSRSAGTLLAALPYDNVSLRIGDGRDGWPEEAPFDAVIVTAAAPDVAVELLRELAPGGRLVAPVGDTSTDQVLTVFTRRGDVFEQHAGIHCRFVPLIAHAESGPPEEQRGGAARHRPKQEEQRLRAIEVRVRGRVQGVFYRGSAQREAQRLGLVGWAQNMSDGSVRLRAQGPASAVDSLLAWCRLGPSEAEVTDVEVSEVDPDPALAGFLTR